MVEMRLRLVAIMTVCCLVYLTTAADAMTTYPSLPNVCTVTLDEPNGRLILVPKHIMDGEGHSNEVGNLASSFAEDPNWEVRVTNAFGSDEGTRMTYTFTPYPSENHNGTLFMSMMETSENDVDYDARQYLCSWSIALVEALEYDQYSATNQPSLPFILHCSSTYNHGLYSLIVEEVATNANDELIVSKMTATYTQSGNALKYMREGPLSEKYMPEVAYFSLECGEEEEELLNFTRVHATGYQYNDISGTYREPRISIIMSLPKSSIDEFSGTHLDTPMINTTTLEDPFDVGQWNVVHQNVWTDRVRHNLEIYLMRFAIHIAPSNSNLLQI